MGELVDGRAVWYGRPVRGCRAFLAAAVFFASTISIASPLGAAEPPTEASPGIVVFAVDPKSRDSEAMVDAVRAHLVGLPVKLVTDTGGTGGGSETGNGGSRPILGTLTIEPASTNEWVVSFTEPAIDTTLVRRIRLKPQGKRVALEEAAIVVRSMVEAILEGGHVGIVRPASEEAAGSPAVSAPRKPRRGMAGTAEYLGTTFAPDLGWQSGLTLGLRWQFGSLYAGISYTIFPVILTETPPVNLFLTRHPGAITVGYEWPSRLAPSIQLDLIADYIQRRTDRVEGDLSETPPEARWNFGLGARAGIAWSFIPRLRLLAHGGVDWMINPSAYLVGTTSVVVAPFPLRPKVAVGLAVDLW
jgi:hypothetical protein